VCALLDRTVKLFLIKGWGKGGGEKRRLVPQVSGGNKGRCNFLILNAGP